MYHSCVTIAIECGPLNVIGLSDTDFRTTSVTGSQIQIDHDKHTCREEMTIVEYIQDPL